MFNSTYAKLGVKHDVAVSQKRLRKRFNKVIGRPQMQEFKTAQPKLFDQLLARQKRAQEKDGAIRLDGRLRAPNLFEYLYPEHKNACATCGTEVIWGVAQKTYQEFCSNACVNNSSTVVARRAKTNNERYGMEPNLHPDVKRKKVATFQKKYGVDNPSQLEATTNKKRETSIVRRGVDHWTKLGGGTFATNNPMKTKAGKRAQQRTLMKNYGVTNPSFSKKIVARIANTHKERYGGNAGAIPHGFKRKICFDVFGKKHVVQGNEPKAIEWFGKQKSVAKISSKHCCLPKIHYTKPNGNRSTYTPDLVVTKKDGSKHVIEVKGSWPLRIDFDVAVAKAKAAAAWALKRGHTYWFFYYPDKGDLVKLKNPSDPEQFKRLLLKHRRSGTVVQPAKSR